MTSKRILGAALDAVTLSTIAVLATIALVGAVRPESAAAVVPLMVGTFAVCMSSGIAKIKLNRRNTH